MTPHLHGAPATEETSVVKHCQFCFSWPSIDLFATLGKHMLFGFPFGGRTAGVAYPAATRQGNTYSKCDVAAHTDSPADQMHNTYTAQTVFHRRVLDRVIHRTRTSPKAFPASSRRFALLFSLLFQSHVCVSVCLCVCLCVSVRVCVSVSVSVSV